jgi:hypothetical protein
MCSTCSAHVSDEHQHTYNLPGRAAFISQASSLKHKTLDASNAHTLLLRAEFRNGLDEACPCTEKGPRDTHTGEHKCGYLWRIAKSNQNQNGLRTGGARRGTGRPGTA